MGSRTECGNQTLRFHQHLTLFVGLHLSDWPRRTAGPRGGTSGPPAAAENLAGPGRQLSGDLPDKSENGAKAKASPQRGVPHLWEFLQGSIPEQESRKWRNETLSAVCWSFIASFFIIDLSFGGCMIYNILCLGSLCLRVGVKPSILATCYFSSADGFCTAVSFFEGIFHH